MITKLFLVILCVFICEHEALPVSQSVPDQIQEFLQQSFFKPIRDKVHEGLQEIADVLAPPSDNSSTNKSASTLSSISTTESISSNLDDALLLSLDNDTQTNLNSSPQSTLLPSLSTETQPLNIISSSVLESEETLSTTLPSVTEHGDQNLTTFIKESRANETYTVVQELKRLCPELAVRDDEAISKGWRYHESSGKCFRIRLRGPCGVGMTFYSIEEPGSINGTCECRDTTRFSIYHESTNACYSIFTQGYCAEGKWLDLTREGKPLCTSNPCFGTSGKDIVYVKGKCVEVNAFSDICTGNLEQVLFLKNKRTPECHILLEKTIAVSNVPCKPGNSLAIHGKCHVSQWDFGDDGTEEDKNSQN